MHSEFHWDKRKSLHDPGLLRETNRFFVDPLHKQIKMSSRSVYCRVTGFILLMFQLAVGKNVTSIRVRLVILGVWQPTSWCMYWKAVCESLWIRTKIIPESTVHVFNPVSRFHVQLVMRMNRWIITVCMSSDSESRPNVHRNVRECVYWAIVWKLVFSLHHGTSHEIWLAGRNAIWPSERSLLTWLFTNFLNSDTFTLYPYILNITRSFLRHFGTLRPRVIFFYLVCNFQVPNQAENKTKQNFYGQYSQWHCYVQSTMHARRFSTGKRSSNYLYTRRKAWARFIAKVWFLHCNIWWNKEQQ